VSDFMLWLGMYALGARRGLARTRLIAHRRAQATRTASRRANGSCVFK